ncbi:PP2C-domain-containing protein [Panus rudis PR-1116 ss-1]|nr:PP2C-domain-containing protein [Panus rudis PR-1116 ss-1]
MIKKRSQSRLRSDLRLHSSPEIVPPLPSPDFLPYRANDPPSPPPPPYSKKRKNKLSNAPPPLPPKETNDFTLDTNLDSMEGIIDYTVLPSHTADPGSPSSGVESSAASGLGSDGSSLHHEQYGLYTHTSPLFHDPFRPSTHGTKRKLIAGHTFDGRKISPKTLVPVAQGLNDGRDKDGDNPALWRPPESWAVVDKEGEDSMTAQDYSSSDESNVGRHFHSNGRKRRTRASMRPDCSPDSGMYKIRIYRANNTYHVVSIDMSVTVAELTPQLNKKLLPDPKAEVHRLYLKERGRERVLAQTEKPASIVRRRLEQAGYDVADGLDILGADDIQFLMKFVYKSNVLGPAEEDLNITDFEYIDLAGRSLKTVPVLLYSHTESIVSLNLSKNPMLEIPLDFIQACTMLRELRLSNMAMKKVPQSIRHCSTLYRLDLSCNRIADLDDAGLDAIPQLRYLKVQNNRLEKLPQYFERLRELHTLNISNNKFRKLPAVVSKISTLVDLDVSFNMISELPDDIGELKKLDRLILVGNRISKFPDGCSGLLSLRLLDCRRNNISDLSTVCMLPKVTTIMADHNAISALDVSFGPSLTSLDASHNDITQLTLAPGPIGTPYALTSLDLSYAKLSSLDGLALSHLTSLRELLFNFNSIRTIPDSIGDLTELRRLACSNNRLYALPASIGNLKKLEILEAHNNSLPELPATIWDCSSLLVMNMTSNLLGGFGDPLSSNSALVRQGGVERKVSAGSISSRSLPPLAYSLEKLYLGENRLSEDVLHPLLLLRELKVLNLSFNDIQELPRGFFKNLAHLRELYLSGNKLSVLPSEDLHQLRELRVLFINGNKLQTLPRELGRVHTLTMLDVGSNVLKYNINNYEFDWNWNSNPNLLYLNFSGNKRFEIKPDTSKVNPGRNQLDRRSLADFSRLSQLKVLGLMDVTTTFMPNIPDDNEQRRVRTSLSEVNGMAYGIADTLGQSLTTFDFVKPEFRERKNEAIFAMFGRSTQQHSHPNVSKFLHDHFITVFSQELDELQKKGGSIEDAMRRSFLKLNKFLHDYLYNRDPRKASTASASGSIHNRNIIDLAPVRCGASGIVIYLVDRTLYVANAGNSLAVISRQGTAELLSTKHDPFERSETARIRAAEGWVSPKGLVNEECDVSRSFGFYTLLPIVNARPDIVVRPLTELDEFLIIANQGLWDHMPYQTAVDIARSERADPMIAAQKLRDFAISYGADGTTMIMVIAIDSLFKSPAMRSRQPTVASLDDVDAFVTRRRRKDEIINRDISRLDSEVSPPTGHVALVFTDIRNSTHLWEVNAGMETAIQIHNQLLRRQLRLCGGYEVKTEGDAFMCSFPTTLSAIWWCLTVQVELMNEGWPLEILECEDGQEIRDSKGNLVSRGLSVRMGIHQGRPLCEPDPITHRMDYLGPIVNRASRISSSAAGGQIMCSADVIRELNATIFGTEERTEYSDMQPLQAIEGIRRLGVEVIPVGEVKLKGLEVPETLSLIYPSALIGRKELEGAETHPGTAVSRVPFDVEQMRRIAMLCHRLEALTSGRIFRPTPVRKGSTTKSIEEEEHDSESNPQHFYANPDILLPALEKASDTELMQVLDSLSLRIENVVTNLAVKRISAMSSTIGSEISRRNGGGLDLVTLQTLLKFLSPLDPN